MPKFYYILFSKEENNTMLILLELGGPTLKDYYSQKIYENDEEQSNQYCRVAPDLLTDILKGAAQALLQFHQHGNITF